LPFGIPGIGEVIEGAIQHAPQWDRQCVIRRGIEAKDPEHIATGSVAAQRSVFPAVCSVRWQRFHAAADFAAGKVSQWIRSGAPRVAVFERLINNRRYRAVQARLHPLP
jgi:hypothetical protein